VTTLYEGMLGNQDLIYPPNALLEDTIQLNHPVKTVRAMIRGFNIGFEGGDRPLTSLSIDIETVYGDAPNQVTVRARARLAGPASEWSATNMLVYYTLVAESE